MSERTRNVRDETHIGNVVPVNITGKDILALRAEGYMLRLQHCDCGLHELLVAMEGADGLAFFMTLNRYRVEQMISDLQGILKSMPGPRGGI